VKSPEKSVPVSLRLKHTVAMPSLDESPAYCGGQKRAEGVLNAFTVDVEDYFQVSAFEKDVHRDLWDRWESRIEANTHRILRLLDQHGVKATFFVLSWIGERYPELVRQIHAAGHEIASHGYWHRLIYEQTPQQFRDDLCRSRDILMDIIGQRIVAYRAPSFSVTKRSLWALEILVEEGFQVDSSVFPIHHNRYGIPGAEPRLHRRTTAAGPLWEFPPSVVRFAGLNVPVSGGGYFRLYPLPWTVYCLRRINRAQRQPFVFYVHPWELDPGQPRIHTCSRLSRFRHYVNLSRNERKLDALLQRFRFGRLCDVIGRQTIRDDVGPVDSTEAALEHASNQ
jgi:polysaccharide deacetylase family protein (PEP-CTERM system associated)